MEESAAAVRALAARYGSTAVVPDDSGGGGGALLLLGLDLQELAFRDKGAKLREVRVVCVKITNESPLVLCVCVCVPLEPRVPYLPVWARHRVFGWSRARGVRQAGAQMEEMTGRDRWERPG